jgi:hypothetical protein
MAFPKRLYQHTAISFTAAQLSGCAFTRSVDQAQKCPEAPVYEFV